MPILFGLICSCLADRDWGASALGETKVTLIPTLNKHLSSEGLLHWPVSTVV